MPPRVRPAAFGPRRQRSVRNKFECIKPLEVHVCLLLVNLGAVGFVTCMVTGSSGLVVGVSLRLRPDVINTWSNRCWW